MSHDAIFDRLPDLLHEREDELLRHVAGCHDCQRRLFLLQRVHDALRSSPPVGRKTGLRRGVVLVASVAAAVALALFLLDDGRPARAYTVAVGARGIVHATLVRGNRENDRLDLQAITLPRPMRTYLLWGTTGDGRRELLGRFMVDRRGSCKVRLSVPRRPWLRFAVTIET